MKAVLAGSAGAALALLVGYFVLRASLTPDFTVLWAAHQVPNPYDVSALHEAIGRVAELPKGPWLYPYPPTFLLLSAWFGMLSLPAAYLAWISISAAMVSYRHPVAPLVLLSPWLIYALMAGQTSLLIGAAIISGNGVLLGIAACIKPQFLILVAVGLAFARRWRTLAEMAIVAAVITGITTAVYGFGLWRGWFDSLPMVAAVSETISPHLDIPSLPLKAVALCLGLFLLWKAEEFDERMIIATGTSLLVLPHSLWYNSAVMAPAMAAYIFRVGWRAVPIAGSLLIFPTSLLVAFATAYSSGLSLWNRKTLNREIPASVN